MDKEYDILPEINRNDLIKAEKYLWVYLPLFITDDMNNNHREIMPKLNTSQQTLLTFYLMNGSMRTGYCNLDENWGYTGGFLQLMYDGYGEYVFEKPFSMIIKTWGAKKISRIVDKAKRIYEKHKDIVEKVKTLKEFSDLCSEITDFKMKKLEYKYMTIGDEEAKKIKKYIGNNINKFAIIDESNSQASYVENDIKEIDDMTRMTKETRIIEKYIKDNIGKFAINDENNTLVINESAIFGERDTLINSINTEINGKRVTVKVKKESRE